MTSRLGERQWQVLLVLAALCVKSVPLAIYGPVLAPDSGGYIDYARMLVTGTGTPTFAMPAFAHTMVFRTIGYPALVASGMLLAGESWPWIVVAVQIMATLVVAVLIYRLLRLLKLANIWALTGGLAYALSLPLVLDQMILTDSIAGALLAMATCLLAGHVVAARRLTALPALGIGVLLLLAFLVREATLYFAGIGILPLAFGAAFADRLPVRRLPAVRFIAWRPCLTVFLVILPLLLGHQIYREWNRARLGVAFVTTAAQTTLPQAMMIVAKKYPAIFDQAYDFDRAAAQTFSTYDFIETWRMNQRLYADYGMGADKIAAAAYESYFRAWRREPLQMLRIPIEHVRFSFMRAWLQPVPSLLMLHLWGVEGAREISLRREVVSGRWLLAPVFALELLCYVVAIAGFLAFLLGAPWRLWRDGLTPAAVAGIGLWVLFFAFYGGYAMVHLEARYLVGVTPAVTVVGLYNLAALWHWCRRRARWGKAEQDVG